MATNKKSRNTNTSRKGTKKSGSDTIPSRIDVSVSKDVSMSIRKIQNGFVVTESGTVGKGKNQRYFSKETFTPKNPINTSAIKFGGK